MNDDRTISTGAIITGCLWVGVILLLLAAWLTWAGGGPESLPVLLGLTACSTSAAAATAQVRCYAVRLCAVIKITRAAESAELRSLR